MNIKSIRLFYDCILEATFFSGDIKLFDVKTLFDSYPSYRKLAEDEKLWRSATLLPHGSGVYFNDEIDLTAEEIWEDTDGKVDIFVALLPDTGERYLSTALYPSPKKTL